MARTHRSTLSTSQKAGIWLAGLFVLWQVLKWSPVFEALMKFVLAGIVPGTNTVLSPATIFEGSIGVLILIVALLVLWPIVRGIRHKRRMVRLNEADAFVTSEEPTELEAVPIVAAAEVPAVQPTFYAQPEAQSTDVPVKSSGPSIGLRIGTLLGSTARFIQTHFAWFVPLAKRCYAQTRRGSKTILVHVGPALHKAGIICLIILRDVRICARLFYVWVIKQSKAFWRWLAPHLHHFDAWLEIKYRLLSKKMSRTMQQNDTLSAIAEVGQMSKQSVSKLELGAKTKKVKSVGKTVAKTTAQKAKPYVRKAHTSVKKTATKARKRSSK